MPNASPAREAVRMGPDGLGENQNHFARRDSRMSTNHLDSWDGHQISYRRTKAETP